MIGGLPMNSLQCEECGTRNYVIWWRDDLRLLCSECAEREELKQPCLPISPS